MPHHYFFSYARSDWEGQDHMKEFFNELRHATRVRLGMNQRDPVAFRDMSMDVGSPWGDVISHELNTALAMVCMTSPSYVKSVWCGKEVQVFLDRQRLLVSPETPGASFSRVIPLIWFPVHEGLPACFSRLQLSNEGFPQEYVRRGIRWLKIRKEPEYRALVEAVADILDDTLRSAHLPSLPTSPRYENCANAFALRVPPETRILTTLPPGTTTFVGRDELIKQIIDAMNNPDLHRMALWGRPGIGKPKRCCELVATAKLRSSSPAVSCLPT
jgi:hypothetical protein